MEFIVIDFKAARTKDPDALLIYNGHKPGKREKLIELLSKLKEAGAPVDAYGMQGHFELGDNSLADLLPTVLWGISQPAKFSLVASVSNWEKRASVEQQPSDLEQ